MRFEWDPTKAAGNIRKHGVSFDDEAHAEQEHREIIIGIPALRRTILVCFVERLEDVVRIISARPATRQEIKDYEENANNQIPKYRK